MCALGFSAREPQNVVNAPPLTCKSATEPVNGSVRASHCTSGTNNLALTQQYTVIMARPWPESPDYF